MPNSVLGSRESSDGQNSHIHPSDGVYTLVEVDYVDINQIIRQIFNCRLW